jgi:hypothetical protein
MFITTFKDNDTNNKNTPAVNRKPRMIKRPREGLKIILKKTDSF